MAEGSNAAPGISARGIAALCSLLLPGLGQLVQGRILLALLLFGSWVLLWCCCLGWIPHALAVIDAALWKPR